MENKNENLDIIKGNLTNWSIPKIEIARSFSYKMSVPNYENRDFFASAKKEVPESEAEKTSEALYKFCKSEVMKSVNQFIKELKLVVCQSCGGTATEQDPIKNGLHENCKKSEFYKTR